MSNANDAELWRPFPRGNGFYEASTFGRIRSVDRLTARRSRWGGNSHCPVRGRVLSPWKDSGGYLVVYLCGEGRREAMNVHRLIADAFCEASDGREFINHKNGDKCDNRPENLEWCTRSENINHALDTGLMKTKRSILGTSKDGSRVLRFDSISDAGRAFAGGKGRGNITSAAAGRIPSAYGFIWQFSAA